MRLIFLPSAAKHGYTEDDALNAIEDHDLWRPKFETSRIPSLPDPDLFVGKALNGDIIEVFTYKIDPDTYIFHCMKLRGKTYIKAIQN